MCYTIWRKVLLKVATFISKPTNESCVDTKISGLEQMMVAQRGVMRKEDVKKDLEHFVCT